MSDTFFLAFGSVGGRVVGILLLPVYTFALSRTEFGTVDLVITSIDLVIPLLFLAVSEATLRFAMLPEYESGQVLRTALTFVASMAVLVGIAAAIASAHWPPVYVMLVAAIVISQSLAVTLGAWARAIGRVRAYAGAGLAQAIAVGVSNIVLLVGFGLGVSGFLLSIVIGNGVVLLVLVARLHCGTAIRGARSDWRLLLAMLAFSVPLVPNVVLWWLTSISGRFFLAWTHGVAAVGLFGVASRFPAIVVMLTTVFSQAWQLATNRVARLDTATRGEFYSQTFRIYSVLLILLISSFLLILKPLMSVAVEDSFYVAWQIVPPLMIGSVFAAFAAFYGAIYTAARRSAALFKTTILGGGSALLLNLALVPPFGTQGAAAAIALCFLSLWVVRVVDSQKIVRTSISGGLLIPALVLLTGQASLLYVPLSGQIETWTMLFLWSVLIVLCRSELLSSARSLRRRVGDE